MSYQAFAPVLDWGGHVTKIIVEMGQPVSAIPEKELAEKFRVHVYKIDQQTGLVAMTPKSFFSKAVVPAVGSVDILSAYPCDADGNPADESEYVLLETDYGPTKPYSALAYQKNGFTTLSDWRCTIEYEGKVIANRGELILEGKELVETGVSASGLNMAWVKPQMENAHPPLIIWLHGAGEGGWDPYVAILGNKVINLASKEIQSYFGGAWLLAPQCQTMWMDNGSGKYTRTGKSKYTTALMDTIEEFIAAHPEIDRSRIYIGGCSNGGFMTMRMVIDYPEYFAGAYPVCEALYDETISDRDIENIKHLPIWFTHAKVDTIVPPEETAVPTYKRLIAAGAENVHFSYYERVLDQTGRFKKEDGTPYEYFGHGSWIYTLNNDCKLDFDGSPVLLNGQPTTIFEWLAAQHK